MQNNSPTAPIFKVSELEKHKFAFHRVIAPIECDTAGFTPPKGLLVAGFPWKSRTSGAGESEVYEVDEDLADTVIAWSSQGNAAKTAQEKIECIIEIDYHLALPPEDLIHLAAAGECSLALVGLEVGATEEQEQEYADQLKKFSAAMLKASNYTKSLYPFSQIFEASLIEKLGKTQDAERIRADWASRKVDIDLPAAARTEYALRRTGLGRKKVETACMEALVEHFGSEELLVSAMRALARPIAKRLESFGEEQRDKPKSKQDRYDLGEANPALQTPGATDSKEA